MEEQVTHTHQQEGSAGHGRRSFPHINSSRFGRSSRLLRRSKSPNTENENQKIAQLTTGANAATFEITPDDSNDAWLGAKTATVDPTKDNDMWAIAAEKLRKDPRKREKLDKYNGILEARFKTKLKPIGTLERREQFLEFLNSEIEHLNNTTKSETRLGRCSNKAKRFLRTAADSIIATKSVITAATTPCLPASVACAGVTVLLSFCVQAADERQLLFDGLNTISGSIYRIAEYEKLLCSDGSHQTEEVKVSITTACCNIIEFQARAACFLQTNPIESAIRNMFKWDGWDKLLSAIKEAEARVKDCAERKSMNDICLIFLKFEEVKSEIGEGFSKLAITQEVIDQKQRVDAFFQLLYDNACSYEDSKNRNRKRVTGTCDWFTNHDLFKEWNLPTDTNLETSRLLFVTADPGCGKSVLSKYLIDEILPDEGRTLCYFFFKDDFENQKSSLGALCTLLHQLFDMNRHLVTPDILNKHGSRGEKFVESFSELWKTFIDVASRQETVCVLDALDECQSSDRNQLIDAITATQVPGLKFLLTSRPYEHIRREFSRKLKPHMASIHLQGDRGPTADAIAREIKLVVDCRIEETADFFRLEPDERRLMRMQLESVQNRTYLWITLVFDGLMGKKSSITRKDIVNLTKTLPQGVYDAYEKILRNSQDQEMCRKLLHLVLEAKRPLSLSEVSVALALNGQQSWDHVAENMIPEDRIQDTIRDLCGLFVTVVDKKVYLLHQTAREFLVCDTSDKETTNIWRLGSSKNYETGAVIFIAQGLALLLATLLHVMRQIFHQFWLSFTNSWQHSMDPTYSNSVLADTCISCLELGFAKENASLFEYSAIYWADHYNQSVENYKVAVAERTRYLCLPELRTQWAEIHNGHDVIPITGSALSMASALGLEKAVKMLLPGQDSQDKRDGRTPLSWAAENGHEAVVKLLLEKGVEPELELKDNYFSRTPLSWAATCGHEAVVKLLLEKGAELETKDENGQTPLSWAATYGHEAVVKLLLEKGAELETKGENGQTPLSWAAACGHEAVVKLLLEKGAELDTNDNHGRTPLSQAIENGPEAVVRLLLEKGAQLEIRDNYGRTPLALAVEFGLEAVIKLLLEKGAELETKDNIGRTPLSRAVVFGYESVVKLLLEKGAELEAKDKNGRTPLSWAAEYRFDAVSKLLLEKGTERQRIIFSSI